MSEECYKNIHITSLINNLFYIISQAHRFENGNKVLVHVPFIQSFNH